MAKRGPNKIKEKISLEKDVNRLAALFKGRINTDVAAELINEHGGLQAAASFLMTGDEGEVKRRLEKNEDYLRLLREDSANFAGVLNSTHQDRQFACVDCDKAWWARVPENKMVSKCHSCKRKFDPIPREHEWGVGEFQCTCGRSFRGFGIMGRTKSKCRSCNGEAEIIEVIPPRRRNEVRRSSNTHNCNGINCYRRYCGPGGCEEKPPVCIHPRSPRTRQSTRIHWASQLHVSTGSTINTFLDQGSLDTSSRSPASSLETIREEDFE